MASETFVDPNIPFLTDATGRPVGVRAPNGIDYNLDGSRFAGVPHLPVSFSAETNGLSPTSISALATSGVADLACVTGLTSANMPRTRAAKAALAAGTAGFAVSIFGNSQVMAAGAGTSGTSNTVGAKARGMTAMLARELTRRGLYAVAGHFSGDQNITGAAGVTYAQYDPCFALGAAGGFQQTTLGRLMVNSTGAGALMSYTPSQTFDTVKATYVGNNVTATCNVDGGASLGTLGANNSSYITTQTVTGITEGAHTLNVTANAVNFFLRSLVFTSSTRPSIQILQQGWYGAVYNNFNSGGTNYDTNPTIARNPDGATTVILRLMVNDANGATDPNVWLANMRVIAQGIIAGGSDLVLSTDEPFSTANAVNGRLQLFINLQKALAVELGVPHIDLCQRYGPAYEALPGDMTDSLHCGVPRQLTTAQVYASFLAAV